VVSSSYHAGEPQRSHHPLHRAAGYRNTLSLELTPELASAIDAEVFSVDLAQLHLQCLVADPSC